MSTDPWGVSTDAFFAAHKTDAGQTILCLEAATSSRPAIVPHEPVTETPPDVPRRAIFLLFWLEPFAKIGVIALQTLGSGLWEIGQCTTNNSIRLSFLQSCVVLESYRMETTDYASTLIRNISRRYSPA